MLKFRHGFIFLIFILPGCNEGSTRKCENSNEWQKNIVKIKYGNSFGFCVGYCWKQIVVTTNEIAFEKMSRDDNEPVSCDRDIDCTEWNSTNKNINLDVFYNLEEVIGCPDCADGGAAWIEIQTVTKTHKVTFDYMSPPTEISDYVSKLHTLMESFSDCH